MTHWNQKILSVLGAAGFVWSSGVMAAPPVPSGTPVQVNIPLCTDANLKVGDYCMYVKGNLRKVSNVLSVNDKGDKNIHFLTQEELVAFARARSAAATASPSPAASPDSSPSASPSASVAASPAASPSASVTASPATSPAAPVKDDELAGCKKTDPNTITCGDGIYKKSTSVANSVVKDAESKSGSVDPVASPSAENAKTGN